MNVFRRHPMAADATASHYLSNTFCLNCQTNSLARFDGPHPAWKKLTSGGCGDLLCTGPSNYFIQDNDGGFLGVIGQMLANNSWIGDKVAGCKFVSRINGYLCENSSFAVLEYESTAKDGNVRTIWPATLTPLSKKWSTRTNAWRSWSWDWSSKAARSRLGRFCETPTGSCYQLQKRQYPYGK